MLRILSIAMMLAAAAANFVPNDPTLDRHGRIVNGDNANSDDWPWFVSLQSSSGFHFCGGSLVARDVVMTAAHCVEGTSPSSMQVKVGAHDLDNSNSGTIKQVQSIISHPQYNSGTLVNDIALIKLSSCMPANYETIPWDTRSETQLFADFASAGAQSGLAAIIGLGALSSGGSSPRILQEARQTVMTHSQCQSAFGSQATIDAPTMICGSTQNPNAGFGDNTNNVDTCQGDSGGPFVTPNPNVAGGWMLTGLTSWGFGCADSTPGVYARVSNYAGTNGWIESNLASSCGPPPPPTAPPPPTTAPPPTSAPPYQFALDCSAPMTGNTGTSGVNTGFQASAEHHYTFTVPASGGVYVFSTCGSGTTYDSFIHIASASAPTVALYSNDDSCQLKSQLSVTLPAGDYILIVEGYQSDTGAYSLSATCTVNQPTPPPSQPTPPPSQPTPPPSAPTPPPSQPTPPPSPPSSALFQVTHATPSGACTVTSSGTCFTDGSGAHANNERCTIRVQQDVTLSVTEFRSEHYWDYLTVNGRQYSGRANGLDGEFVRGGDDITWHSDASVTRAGFAICGNLVPSPPTGPVFRIASATSNSNGVEACSVSANGRCFSDGSGNHENDERCSIEVLQGATLRVIQFDTETGYDVLTVNSVGYSGHAGPSDVQVAAGHIIQWRSDESVTRGGFEICV